MLPRFAFLSFECGGTNVDWQGSDRRRIRISAQGAATEKRTQNFAFVEGHRERRDRCHGRPRQVYRSHMCRRAPNRSCLRKCKR